MENFIQFILSFGVLPYTILWLIVENYFYYSKEKSADSIHIATIGIVLISVFIGIFVNQITFDDIYLNKYHEYRYLIALSILFVQCLLMSLLMLSLNERKPKRILKIIKK